jgi:hypothetical protein
VELGSRPHGRKPCGRVHVPCTGRQRHRLMAAPRRGLRCTKAGGGDVSANCLCGCEQFKALGRMA